MSTPSRAISYILSNNATLTAQVPSVRISPQRTLEKLEMPAIVYQLISNNPHNTKDGPSTFDQIRFTIEVWGSYKQVDDISALVRSALDGVRNHTASGLSVDSIVYETERDLYDDDTQTAGRSTDYFMFYHRSHKNI